MYRKTVRLRERQYGHTHPTLARSLEMLANIQARPPSTRAPLTPPSHCPGHLPACVPETPEQRALDRVLASHVSAHVGRAGCRPRQASWGRRHGCFSALSTFVRAASARNTSKPPPP